MFCLPKEGRFSGGSLLCKIDRAQLGSINISTSASGRDFSSHYDIDIILI